MVTEEIAELIARRRRQILVHSIIYYKFNKNIVSDHQWAEWALELEELQSKHYDVAKQQVYADAFEDFDPSTGFNLPLWDPWAINKARQLLMWHKERS